MTLCVKVQVKICVTSFNNGPLEGGQREQGNNLDISNVILIVFKGDFFRKAEYKVDLYLHKWYHLLPYKVTFKPL